MKKTFGIIALLMAIVLTLSAHTSFKVDTVTGKQAPNFILTCASAERQSLLPADRQGYLLLNFWASNDARSRIDATLYDTAVKQLGPHARVTLTSVNFDSNEALFREIVRHERLDASRQLHITGEDARELKTLYSLEQGYRSLLIDQAGKIVAVNPDPAMLASL